MSDVATHITPDHFFGVEDDRKYNNEQRAQEKGLEPCTHCGRGVAPGKGWVTTVIDGGEHVVNPNDVTPEMESDSGFMGSWILGSTCAKGVPMAFRVKYEG